MYFFPALGAQTISGTVSMMLMTREGAGTDNVDRPWMAVFVVRGNAKVATLLALGVQTGAATTEWVANATHRTCTFANGANLSSFACSAGDKILVEVGGGNNTSGTSPEFSCKYGENATDATINDNATTTDRAGWIEFSANLTLDSTPVDAGSMTTTATSTTTAAFLLGLVMAVMTSIASSVTSLLTLLGILTGSQTSQTTTGTTTEATIETAPEAVETGSMTTTSTSSVSTASQVGLLTGAITTSGTSSTSTESTVEAPPSDGGGNHGGGCRRLGLGMGM